MQITKEQVKAWHACTDGFRWFLDKFPQGGAYADVHGALIADKRFDDARWLVDKMYRTHLDKAEFIQAETAATDKMIGELTSMEHPSAQVEGENSSGDYARIGSSGYNARIGSSGYNAQIGSSGYNARIGSSGDYARITASGKGSVVACAGSIERIVLGEGGCASVPWHDGKRTRIAVAYVGENGIEANTPYYVNDEGQFVKVEE
ncbi:hypothetical protein [Salmonella enterica]|uniref:hypothetical protein n=1 Tax=Salmonella enterica TaxID=28901 RepID=UPI0025704A25|nr:hypothetical protein [Salmonella enterica]MDL4274389.1 hypothetical protein [Salmonella enterica]